MHIKASKASTCNGLYDITAILIAGTIVLDVVFKKRILIMVIKAIFNPLENTPRDPQSSQEEGRRAGAA